MRTLLGRYSAARILLAALSIPLLLGRVPSTTGTASAHPRL